MSRNEKKSKYLGSHERSAVIFKSQLSSSEKLILLAISQHLINKDECWPSQTRLSQLTGYRRPSINRVIRRLTESGILKTRSQNGSSCRYEIDWHRMLDVDDLSSSITPAPVSESDTLPVTDDDGGVTESDGRCHNELHGRRKEGEKKVEPPEGGNVTRAETGGEKLSEQDSSNKSEEEQLASMDRHLGTICNKNCSIERRLAAVISFQSDTERYLGMKPPTIRKDIDVMQSLTELDSEVRAVDLLDALAAFELYEKVWTVLITEMNWRRIMRAAANYAGYRLFRENGITQYHQDPSDTALESFWIYQAKARKRPASISALT